MFFFLLLYSFLNEFIAYGGPFALYSIGCIILTAAIVGVVLGGLTFREGKNVFGISGFIISLFVVIFQAVCFYAIHVLLNLD